MSIILKVGSGGKCLGAYRDLGNRELPLGVTGWLLATKEISEFEAMNKLKTDQTIVFKMLLETN
jgi:hypothetical protein